MPQKSLQRSQRLLIWLGILPALLGITAYLISSRHVSSVQSTLNAAVFAQQWEDLLSTVKDAETGQRGYLLTGDRGYLAPYHQALRRLPDMWARLEAESLRRRVPRDTLQTVRRLLHEKLAELAKTIELRRTKGIGAALVEVQTNRGERSMTELRRLVDAVRTAQQQKVAKALAIQQLREKLLDVTLAAGVLLGITLSVLAYQLSNAYARQRDIVDEEIRCLVQQRTAELEQRTVELERRTCELQSSNEDLLQFAYVSSHDLQEPLRTVASYVGLLARRYEGQLDETAQKYIAFAVSGANRMQALINDLLQYSQVGTSPLKMAEISMDQVVRQALDALHARIIETNAMITVQPLPRMTGDASKLTQVFQNLIANATKFRRVGVQPVIQISALRDKADWIIQISDNGIGFEEKYTDRIFQVFQRLHGVGEFPGNGIGLAICRRIIEHHGGKLWATSKPGIGSTFLFSIPAANQANAGAGSEPVASG